MPLAIGSSVHLACMRLGLNPADKEGHCLSVIDVWRARRLSFLRLNRRSARTSATYSITRTAMATPRMVEATTPRTAYAHATNIGSSAIMTALLDVGIARRVGARPVRGARAGTG